MDKQGKGIDSNSMIFKAGQSVCFSGRTAESRNISLFAGQHTSGNAAGAFIDNNFQVIVPCIFFDDWQQSRIKMLVKSNHQISLPCLSGWTSRARALIPIV